MKVRKSSILFSLALYASMGVFGMFALLLQAPAAHAAPAVSFAYDYNPSPQNVTAMVNAAKVPRDDASFQSSEIYAQGGALFGSGAEFTYQRLVTGQGQTSGYYQYSYDYTCQNGQPQTQDPATNVYSYTVELSVFLFADKNFYNETNLSGLKYYVTHVTFNGAEVTGQPTATHPDAHNVSGIPENDSNITAMNFPSSCVAYPFAFGNHRSIAEGTPIPNLETSPQNVKDTWAPVTQAAQAAGPGGAGPNNGGGGAASTDDICASKAGTFGWLLCPAIDLANTTIKTLVTGVIIPELTVTPLKNTGSEYDVWQSMRTLADVLFVLIFMVIIFANTLQFDLNAYTIKKIIPKLVAAAILVQFSYIISSLFVDIGNVLGQGMSGLITVVSQTPTSQDPNPLLTNLGAAFDTGLLIGAVAVIGIPTIMIAALTGLISIIGVVFTLVARQLIIIMLTVLAPLAFAAFVLPNTDKYFSVWLKMFIRITLMFPLIILLLNIAVIGQNAVKGNNLESLLAVIFPIIAFFMIPMTFKWAGGAMSFAAGGIGKLTKRGTGATKGAQKSLQERQKRLNQERASGLRNATVFGRNVPGSRRVLTGLGKIGTGKILPTNRNKSAAALATQKAIADESKRIESLNLEGKVIQALVTGDTKGLSDAQKTAYRQNSSLGKTYAGRAALANQMAKQSNVEGLEKFRQKLNDDVKARVIAAPQATQLWNAAKAGAFKEIKARDPIMAGSGWATGEYDGTMPGSTPGGPSKLQESLNRLSGDDVASIAESRLKTYAAAGATLSAGQLQAASSDKARAGKGSNHQDHLLRMAQQGGAAADPAVQFERLLRFDYSTGRAVARDDTTVQAWRRKYATDSGYHSLVDSELRAGRPFPPPP